jgi:hypothetical protein
MQIGWKMYQIVLKCVKYGFDGTSSQKTYDF